MVNMLVALTAEAGAACFASNFGINLYLLTECYGVVSTSLRVKFAHPQGCMSPFAVRQNAPLFGVQCTNRGIQGGSDASPTIVGPA
jgi:hypothetical protein